MHTDRDLGILRCSLEGSDGLEFLRELRRFSAAQVVVKWKLAAAISEHMGIVLSHLYPPVEEDGEQRGATCWREKFSLYNLYYRVGPGFVLVVDYRFSAFGEETMFVDQEASDFLALETTGRSTEDRIFSTEFGGHLQTLDLYLPGIKGGLLLPVRTERWPIPWSSV